MPACGDIVTIYNLNPTPISIAKNIPPGKRLLLVGQFKEGEGRIAE